MKIFIRLIFLFYSTTSFTQNLAPNGSFETPGNLIFQYPTNNFSNNEALGILPKHWNKFGSADWYYDGTPPANIFNSTSGIVITPIKGKGFVGFGDCEGPDTRPKSDNHIMYNRKVDRHNTEEEIVYFYPNPATDFLKISTTNYETEFLIYDMYGRLKLTNKINANFENTIDINFLEKGMHLLVVKTKNKVYLNEIFIKI